MDGVRACDCDWTSDIHRYLDGIVEEAFVVERED